MALSKPAVGEMNTIAVLQTNIQKILYGSAAVGAGFKDKFTDFTTVRGKFFQVKGTRVLADGSVIPIQQYVFQFRFDKNINNIVSYQLRFLIDGKTYSVDSFTVDNFGRESFFYMRLNLFT